MCCAVSVPASITCASGSHHVKEWSLSESTKRLSQEGGQQSEMFVKYTELHTFLVSSLAKLFWHLVVCCMVISLLSWCRDARTGHLISSHSTFMLIYSKPNTVIYMTNNISLLHLRDWGNDRKLIGCRETGGHSCILVDKGSDASARVRESGKRLCAFLLHYLIEFSTHLCVLTIPLSSLGAGWAVRGFEGKGKV